jgi:hypothetical protein
MTWEQTNKKRLPFIRMGGRLFKGMYNDIKMELKEVLKDRHTPESIVEAVRGFQFDDDIVQSAYLRFYIRTGIYFAKEVKKGQRGGLEKKDNSEEVWTAIIAEYVKTSVGKRIGSVTRTAYKDIEKITADVVAIGINEGWGMDKIANAIVKKQGEIDTWKALRIARTEVIAASNEGVMVGASELVGSKVKVWISTFDDRSRPDHMEMDGVRVGWNDKFIVNGDQLEFPGDPLGLPENTINCRCGYEVIVEKEIY